MKYKTLQKPLKFMSLWIIGLFLIGSCMHFLFALSGNNPFIALFAAVNESVWEHMKLVLLPMILSWFIYYAAEHKKYSIDRNKWFTSAFLSLSAALITIPLIFYFYTEAFGIENIAIDILIFFIALVVGQSLAIHFYLHSKGMHYVLAICLILFLLVVFMVFTYFPPHLPIFQDSLTNRYGILP